MSPRCSASLPAAYELLAEMMPCFCLMMFWFCLCVWTKIETVWTKIETADTSMTNATSRKKFFILFRSTLLAMNSRSAPFRSPGRSFTKPCAFFSSEPCSSRLVSLLLRHQTSPIRRRF